MSNKPTERNDQSFTTNLPQLSLVGEGIGKNAQFFASEATRIRHLQLCDVRTGKCRDAGEFPYSIHPRFVDFRSFITHRNTLVGSACYFLHLSIASSAEIFIGDETVFSGRYSVHLKLEREVAPLGFNGVSGLLLQERKEDTDRRQRSKTSGGLTGSIW